MERKEKADKQAMATAARELSKALSNARAGREAPDMPAILARFKQRVGGTERLADLLYEDFQRVRGADLPPDMPVKRQEQIIQRYHQMLFKAFDKKDERVSTDLSNISDEDLRATLIGLAMDLVREDPDFRREVAIEALKEDPGLLAQIVCEHGRAIENGKADDRAD